MVNWVDTTMLIACLGGLAFGLLGGFLKLMIPFLFLLAGVGLAGTVSMAVGPSLPELLGEEHSREAIVFLVVFAALLAVGGVVSSIMSLGIAAATTAISVAPVGALLNRAGGAVAGLIYGCILLSVLLIALQQIPIPSVYDAVGDSSFAHRPIGWVDRYAPSIEISPDWERLSGLASR